MWKRKANKHASAATSLVAITGKTPAAFIPFLVVRGLEDTHPDHQGGTTQGQGQVLSALAPVHSLLPQNDLQS